VLREAFAPLADGVAVAAQLGGDLLVAGLVVSCGEQDDAAAQGQGLGGGAGAGQRLEFGFELGLQVDPRAERTRHVGPPDERNRVVALLVGSMARLASLG
jgi:hypothetical protein